MGCSRFAVINTVTAQRGHPALRGGVVVATIVATSHHPRETIPLQQCPSLQEEGKVAAPCPLVQQSYVFPAVPGCGSAKVHARQATVAPGISFLTFAVRDDSLLRGGQLLASLTSIRDRQ